MDGGRTIPIPSLFKEVLESPGDLFQFMDLLIIEFHGWIPLLIYRYSYTDIDIFRTIGSMQGTHEELPTGKTSYCQIVLQLNLPLQLIAAH
jgi:hypothetical protein